MGKTQKNQSGFSAIEGLLVVVIVAILGSVGWYVWHVRNTSKAKSTTSTSSTTATKPAKDPYAGWKTYCDTFKIGCVKYPSTWIVKEALSGQKPNVQFVTPTDSSHPIDILYSLSVSGPGTSKGDKIVASSDLATPINDLKVYQATISATNAPYIAIVDTSGSFGHTTKAYTWALNASPNDLPYSSIDKANAWFVTDEAKTALQIVQSFTYQ